MGEASGERPPSEISVLEDSAPGEVTGPFHPKKELILFPGVFGWFCFNSKEVADAFRAPAESIRSGGGRLGGGCNAMAGGEGRTGMKGSLTSRLCRGFSFENCAP